MIMGKQTHGGKSDDQVVTQLTLPIDKFESVILRSIQTQRITIIQGDTGCGKSSRVPTMILRAPVPQCDLSEVKIYISQPRRIAAKSLVERVRKTEVDISHKVALRMGHDEQEYETTETRAWFVTSFYLLWLLANDTKHFDDVTHIIIDEAHERSVHAEILCLSCRRLLQSNPHIRLVLMSATLDVDMYAKYFGVSQPPIQISGCPFKIKAFFVEDLPQVLRLSYNDHILVGEVVNECNSMKCRLTPQQKYMEKLYRLAVRTVECVGKPGTSILIFVAGMADIMSIIDLVENLNARALRIRYSCFPIHSDIAFSEKMAALETPAVDEIKIIIGTNAAESSITFPDVDHVICLGLQKQILYDEATHAQLLCPTWISRANAIQRAGRTGRTGNGNVYRLYSRKSFEDYMPCNEIGEMSRVPLDSVILAVKASVNEPAIEVLKQCLEPPNLKTVKNSFVRLYNQKFLSSPNDGGSITNLGSMVASLGVDLKLGTLIGLGIQFGVAPEVIELATILSFSKSPWISCNFWAQEPQYFNETIKKTFASKCHFDANLYSDPLAIMNLIWDFQLSHDKIQFCSDFNLTLPRLQRMISIRNGIVCRISNFFECSESQFRVQNPPSQMPHSKIVILRIILVWVFHENIIRTFHASNAVNGSVSVSLSKDEIQNHHLQQILDETQQPFQLINHKEILQKGVLDCVQRREDLAQYTSFYEERFISYCIESNIEIASYRISSSSIVFLVDREVAHSSSFSQIFYGMLQGYFISNVFVAPYSWQMPEYTARSPCANWRVMYGSEDCSQYGTETFRFVRFMSCQKEDIKELSNFIKTRATSYVDKVLFCHFTVTMQKGVTKSVNYSLHSLGKVERMSNQDLVDLFSTRNLSEPKKSSTTQKVRFNWSPNLPLQYNKEDSQEAMSGHVESFSSWNHPLLFDIPAGARLLSVLASSRKKEHCIEFVNNTSDSGGKCLTVELNWMETRISERWSDFRDSNTRAYVEVSSVPAAALPLEGPQEIFAVAGSFLALATGGVRVSSLTLLPPGRLFLLLCFKSFGLHPGSLPRYKEREEVEECKKWLELEPITGVMYKDETFNKTERILQAIEFHKNSSKTRSALEIYPDLIVKLLSIFDQVDGYECVPWEEAVKQPEKLKHKCRNEYPSSVPTEDMQTKLSTELKTSPSNPAKGIMTLSSLSKQRIE